MKMPIRTRERVTFVNNEVWIVYLEEFATVKHIYMKRRGWAYFTHHIELRGKQYNEDYMYHAQKYIRDISYVNVNDVK